MTDTLFPDPAPSFALSCHGCSAGDGINSLADAESAGWTDVEDNDGPSWNQLGICPTCQRESVWEEAAAHVRRAYSAIDPDEAECNARWPESQREASDAVKMLAHAREIGERLKLADANVAKERKWRQMKREATLEASK